MHSSTSGGHTGRTSRCRIGSSRISRDRPIRGVVAARRRDRREGARLSPTPRPCGARVATDIRRWLQPSELARETAEKRHAELLALPSKTAVHVRRGDFVTNPRHRPCPITFYEQAVELTRAESPSTEFLVFSDDIEWCRRKLGIPEALYVTGNPDWLDLTLMSQCEQHICSNSTFSWWGAFLSTNPSPIVPWLRGVAWPVRMTQPEGWRELEVLPDD